MTTSGKQEFRKRPEPHAETEQNHDILLPCEVQFPDLIGHVVWQKDDKMPIFMSTRKSDKPQVLEPDFFQMDGDPAKGEFNLNLKKARLEDSGTYECQVHSKKDDGNYLRGTTHLLVKKQTDNREETLLSTLASNAATAAVDEPTDRAKANSLQARDITSSSLPPGKLLSKLVQQQQQQQQFANSQIFIKPHASTATQTNGLEGGSSILAHLNIHWPYLLFLAFILLIANIYLFVTLFRRHRRNHGEALNKPGHAGSATSSTTTNLSTVNHTTTNQITTTDGFLQNTSGNDSSVESGSNGSCSAATASSQLQCTITGDMSTCDLELFDHQSSSLQHHQHQIHLQPPPQQTLYVPALLQFQQNQQQHHQQYHLQQQQQQQQQQQPIQYHQPMSPSALHPWVLEI